MQLQSLILRNFRNYKELELEIPEGFTVFVGPNGAGKSNLLEAAYYLGTASSYRHHPDESLVRWGTDFFLVRGKFRFGSFTRTVEVAYSMRERKKIVRLDGKRSPSKELACYLPMVVFSPADILIIQGPPNTRRRYLDLVVCQLRPQHFHDLILYQDILGHRNSLLRQEQLSSEALQPWDEQLVAVGARILQRRLEVLFKLCQRSDEVLKNLTGAGGLEVQYLAKSFPCPLFSCPELPELQHALYEALRLSREREVRVKSTVVGPHRDDFCFYFEGQNYRYYRSQGEQRLLLLALKISQAQLIVTEVKEKPLLILDDLFSELDDQHRQQLLLHLIAENQILATTTSLTGSWVVEQRVNLFEVNHGQVFSRG